MRFRSDPAQIRGSIAPVVSPFTADGAPDTEGLRGLIRWQLESGSHGISLGGSTGEPSAQSTAERAAAIRAAADEIADRVPFVPGTGSAKLDETLELTAIAAAGGRGRGADHHPVLRAAHPGGPVPLVRHGRPRVPRPAAHRLQRAVAHRGRHRAGDGRAAAPRPSQHRRGQGDHQGLRALLPGAARGRAGHADLVGHRTAVPAAAVARRGRVRLRHRQPGARRHRPDVRAVAGRRVRGGPRPALRAAPGDRRDLHGDQPGGGQVGARAGRADRLRLRPAAARAAHRGRAGDGACDCCGGRRRCSRDR